MLPAELLPHVVKLLPAEDLGRAEATSRALRAAVERVVRERAAVCEANDAPLYVAFDLLRAEHVAGARAVDGDVVLGGRGGDGDDDAALAAAFAARPEGLRVSGMTQELDACARGEPEGRDHTSH